MKMLKILLFLSAFGWGVSILGVLLPWDTSVNSLMSMGAKEIPNDPMLNYWFHMTCGSFTMIGILFLIAGLNPMKYKVVIPVLGVLMVLEGVVLLIYGLSLGLKPFPFYSDTAFCTLLGIGIIMKSKCLKQEATN